MPRNLPGIGPNRVCRGAARTWPWGARVPRLRLALRGAPRPCLLALGAAGRPGKARRYAYFLKINVLDGGWARGSARWPGLAGDPIKGLASDNNALPVLSQKLLGGLFNTGRWEALNLIVFIGDTHNTMRFH